MSDDALEREIGQDAMAKVRAAGWTPPPPKPEPKRLVTMEESRERFVQGIYPAFPTFGNGVWGSDEGCRDRHADNWLVRTYCKRIIEGLPPHSTEKWVRTNPDLFYHAHRPDLLRIFAGEGV